MGQTLAPPSFAIPAKAGIHGKPGSRPAPGRPLQQLGLQIRVQIDPTRVVTLDQVELPLAFPFFDLLFASDRRLGAYTNAWKGTTAAPDTDYSFTLIELRAGPKGTLEGKTSLTNKIAVDNDAKIVALENYSTIPTTLRR